MVGSRIPSDDSYRRIRYRYTIPECSICHNLLTDNLSFTSCGHIFHQNCQIKCFKKDHNCQVCRTLISPPQINKLYFKIEVEKINDYQRLKQLGNIAGNPNIINQNLILKNQEIQDQLDLCQARFDLKCKELDKLKKKLKMNALEASQAKFYLEKLSKIENELGVYKEDQMRIELDLEMKNSETKLWKGRAIELEKYKTRFLDENDIEFQQLVNMKEDESVEKEDIISTFFSQLMKLTTQNKAFIKLQEMDRKKIQDSYKYIEALEKKMKTITTSRKSKRQEELQNENRSLRKRISEMVFDIKSDQKSIEKFEDLDLELVLSPNNKLSPRKEPKGISDWSHKGKQKKRNSSIFQRPSVEIRNPRISTKMDQVVKRRTENSQSDKKIKKRSQESSKNEINNFFNNNN